ncbi:hypothetical protein [Gracilimonas sp.]|uniref:hypothetical protein n=1 Tax=Gracilimonas sp. TaxID=1974203 RepID=UPI0025C10669|nr:hypothetical protein [Gracilimonas sp.]
MKLSDVFILGSAFLSMLLSIYLWFTTNPEAGIFVGIWVPSLLGFGIYIKNIYRSPNE